MRIVQAVVAVVPPVLVLWMGAVYILDAGRLLLAPGVPITFDYKSPEGPIRLWADGYEVHPDLRTAALWGMKATRENGAVLGSVERVDASGLDPFALRPNVKIRGVRARVVRDEKGIDLARLLPKREGPPSKIPYSVTVTDVRALFVDRTFKKPVQQIVQTDRMAFDGIGDDWRGEGRVVLPGVGVADARAQSLANVGVTIDLRSQALRLGRFVPILAPGVTVESAVARGPVRIDLPTKGATRLAATLKAEVRGARYREYAADSVLFDGTVGQLGVQGVVLARAGEVRARFEGTATAKEGGGRVVASVPSPASLPPFVRRLIPPKAGFRDADYAGWVSWKGSVARAEGNVRAASASFGTDALDRVSARVAYSPDGVGVRGLTASWRGAPLAGDGFYDPRSRAVRGALVAPRVELATLAKRLGGPKDVGGFVGGQALVSGTIAKPEVEGRVAGRVVLGGRELGDVEASGAWLAGAARVDRVKVSGPLGAIVAGGTVRPDGTLDLKAEARGLRIERLMPDARGLVSANLNVGGTLRNPKATGRLEAYRLAYNSQAIPAAGFDLAADRRRIDLTLLTAVRGTARLRGRVGASLVGAGVTLTSPRSWLVDGRFSLIGVQASEIPGSDAVGDVAGLLSIPQATLSGRLGDPVLTAGLEGDGLIVRGVRMESLRADARVDRRGARMSNLEVLGAGGRMTGAGTYSFAAKSGEVDLAMADLQLSRLLADVSQDVLVDGAVSAPRVHLAIRDGKPVGQAEGRLSAIKVNGVLAGDGNWTLDATGDRIKAEASVGRLDPTLRALDAAATYNVKEGSLAATVQAKDIPVQTVVAAVQARRASSEDEARRLGTVKGDLSGTVELVRLADGELKIDASDLQAAGIQYEQVDYGTLTATTLVRRGGRWTLAGGRLVGTAGTFAADGWVEEDGDLDLQASGDAIKISAFSPFVADLAQFTGSARFALSGSGSVDKPVVTGSAAVDGLFADAAKESVGASLERIEVRDGKSSVAGVLRYGGRFGGLFSASTDWAYRSDINAAAVDAKVDLGALEPLDPADPTKGMRAVAVSLDDIPGLRDYIDEKRGGGTLAGGFGVTGRVGAPRFTGGLELVAERLGITTPGGGPVARMDDTLRNVKVNLGFDERNAPLLTLSTGFERGGTLTAMATLGDLGGETVLETLSKTRDWKGLPVAGRFEIDDKAPVTIRQTVAGGVANATVVGRATVSGKAVSPLIAGRFAVSDFAATMPSLEEGGGESGRLTIDPSFDLRVGLTEPGKFSTATADLFLLGDFTLEGSLSNPTARAEMLTDSGRIRLPGGVVRVDKGGQISFLYKRPLSGGTPASATLDIQGRSQITLARQGLGTQRYDVVLDMQGDLLRENGIRFDATSDPSDLSKDEILNALGGTQLISGISEGGASTERNVRNAFVGFALPGLLDTFTSGIAKGFGLDYVSLEYNEFDQATVAFAKSLGPDFTFQGRQQVGATTPGYRAVFDARLSYNPRRLLPKLSRFSISAGVDQDRPWKAAIEYGTRFGQRGNQDPSRHVLFPAKKP